VPSRTEQLTIELQGRVAASLASALPTLTFGQNALDAQKAGAAPRIVWVWDDNEEGRPPSHAGASPRALATRVCVLNVHIWGQSEEQAEELFYVVVRAALEMFPGACQYAGASWPTRADPDRAKRGALVIPSLEFAAPIPAAAPELVRILSVDFDSTQAVTGDHVLEAGET
jgi:hypothetical protein